MLRIATYNFKAIIEGGISLLPGANQFFSKGTRGTDSALYCYAVWMRHLIKTKTYRSSSVKGTVVELGPGDSLGIGLAALLSGANCYIALDVVRHANVEQNLAVFAELVKLFTKRASIPSSCEFPALKPELEEFSFPDSILDPLQMANNLAPERIEAIAAALKEISNDRSASNSLISYVDPATAKDIITPESVELVFSQAVLEHVDDLLDVYQACYSWLVENGLMSHQVDFKSHGTSLEWNGHWVYPELVWRVLRGRRPYLLNRTPCETHLELMRDLGFEVLRVERTQTPSRLLKSQLAERFQEISELDMNTSSAFIVARKRAVG